MESKVCNIHEYVSMIFTNISTQLLTLLLSIFLIFQPYYFSLNVLMVYKFWTHNVHYLLYCIVTVTSVYALFIIAWDEDIQ